MVKSRHTSQPTTGTAVITSTLDGNAEGNASFTITDANGATVVSDVTDANGNFNATLPAGDYSISGTDVNGNSFTGTFTVVSGQQVQVSMAFRILTGKYYKNSKTRCYNNNY